MGVRSLYSSLSKAYHVNDFIDYPNNVAAVFQVHNLMIFEKDINIREWMNDNWDKIYKLESRPRLPSTEVDLESRSRHHYQINYHHHHHHVCTSRRCICLDTTQQPSAIFNLKDTHTQTNTRGYINILIHTYRFYLCESPVP